MAKGPFWLRGAKGKLAGSVIFKGESGTVVRENVKPRNPKTNPQMRQRVVWATITQAAKKMLPIIGISFEGVNSEKLNRRRFVQLNSTLFARHAQNPSMDNVCAWSGKGNNQLIPNPYIVSRGSLMLPKSILMPTFEDEFYPAFKEETVSLTPGTYTAFQLWDKLYGIEPDSQITIPYISIRIRPSGIAYTLTDNENNPYDCIRYARLYAPRIVLKDEGQEVDSITLQGDTTIAQITATLASAVNTDKTSRQLLECFTNIQTSELVDNRYEITIGPDWESLMVDNLECPAAVGAIYSKQDTNGIWHYSNCELNSGRSWAAYKYNDQTYFGLDLRNAIKTYKSEASREANYLQTGGDGGDID